MSQGQTKARFTGVVAFKDKNAAMSLGLVVNSLLDKSVSIFNDAKTNKDAPRFLKDDVDKVVRLCDNFVVSAKTEKGAQESEDCIFQMKEQQAKLHDIIAQYEAYQPWTLLQSNTIAETLKGVLGNLEVLMNISERETAEAIIEHIKVCLRSTKSVVTANEHQNFTALADDFTYNCLYLARILDNRVKVTKQKSLKERLDRANNTLKVEISPTVESCRMVRKDPSGPNLDSKERHVKALSGALREAIEVVSQGLAALSEFSYTPIDQTKFNNKLDDLINSINSGDAQNVADNARYLAGQLNDLERRKGLEDAKARLRQQTSDLLAASKNALKDKDSADAKNRLNDIVSAMKNQVADLAKQEEARRRRQQELLKSAGGIGLAINQLEEAAGGQGSSGTKSKAELERELQNKYGREIGADEARREREVEQRFKSANIPYSRAEPASSSSSRSQTQDDKDMDDLLAGLDDIDVGGSSSSTSQSSGSSYAPKYEAADDHDSLDDLLDDL